MDISKQNKAPDSNDTEKKLSAENEKGKPISAQKGEKKSISAEGAISKPPSKGVQKDARTPSSTVAKKEPISNEAGKGKPISAADGKGKSATPESKEKNINSKQAESNILTDSTKETSEAVKAGAGSVSELGGKVADIASNPDMSAGDKALAIGVAGVQAVQAVQGAVGAVTGFVSGLVDKAFMSIMENLSFLRGIACLPIVKQLDPVIGIDVHVVMIPAPVPMPHVYLGIMFEPMDFVSCLACSVMAHFTPPPPTEGDAKSEAISMGHQMITGFVKSLGATVKIGPFIPRVVATTKSLAFHIPMGPLAPAPPVKTPRGHAFLGSLFVYADNFPLTGGFLHLHNDCWDFGIPPIAQIIQNAAQKLFRFPKPPKPPEPPSTPPRVGVVELFLPTGIMIPIPWNRPILVNPVPTPINPTEIVNIFVSAGFAKLRECAIGFLAKTKLGQKLGCGFWSKVSDKYGTGTSHPADVSEGHFYTKSTDFSVSGIIPLAFKRKYNSYSDYKSPIGIGWSHCYDMALVFDEETNQAGVRLDDGRTTAFEIPKKGESSYNRGEKLWLHHHEDDHFYLSDKKGHIYRFTNKEYTNPYNNTEAHLLQSISNRNGYSIRFSYNNDGLLTSITDTAGRVYIVQNDKHGRINRIISPQANKHSKSFCVAEYEYDKEGRLVSQINALGYSMHFEYQGTLMTKEVWRNGLGWTIKYDGKGTDAKCLEIRGDGGLYHHKLEYIAENCTKVTNSLGAVTLYYHRKGVVTKRIDPNGGETIFRYNDHNELEWTSDPLKNTTTAIYDEWGNMINKTSADGAFTQIEYNNKQFPYLPTSAIDSVGGRWKWEYDTQGNLVRRTNPIGANTSFDYDDGLLSVITGAKGQQTNLFYDNQANLVKAVSPDGGTNKWQYDLLGQCIQYENAREGISEYEYNLLGDVITVKLPDGNIRQLTYDEQGNVIMAKDNDRHVTFTYTGVNKLASRTEKGASLLFVYDTEDQLRSVVNEHNEEYIFKLDSQGRVIEERGFDGLTREYRRDIGGRVTGVTRPNGKEVYYEYDEVGRVTQVTYDDGTTEHYAYRKDGLLVEARNEDATVTLQRDILGRVIKETCNGRTVTSKYDIANNRTHISSSLGAEIEAEYNLLGDVISMAADGWQNQYKRDEFGLEIKRLMNGDVATYTGRDQMGRVTSQTIGHGTRTMSEKSYQWGVNNKLLSIVDNGQITNFEYDTWGNLAKTTFEDGKVEYRNPDKSGNLFERPDRFDRTYTKGGQLVRTEKWEYKYDSEGNLIRKKAKDGQTWRYEWNQAGMLARVKRPDAKEVTFRYDALGRRIEKRFNNNVTHWLWDGNVPLHEWKESEVFDFMGQADDLTTWVFEEGTFVPAAKIKGNKKLSIVTNYMGTPEAMYDENGSSTWSCSLSSYGRVRKFEGHHKTDCPFRYQGQYEDSETGLYYNRFRYYSPEEGVYISQDPIGIGGGFNLYSYVKDTNSWVDPTGLIKKNPNGYKTGDVDKHRNLSPGKNRATGHSPGAQDNQVQSHHAVQDEWAQANINGYRRNEAPAILLESSSGYPHAQISASQRADRAANGFNSSTLSEELRKSYRDMINAGVPEEDAKKAISDAYKYFDSLRDENENNPCYDI